MADYSGFATLGDIITGGSRREAEANYPKYLGEAANGYKALDLAAEERAKRLARDAVGERYRAWAAAQGLSPEAADLGATYATGGDMNFNTQMGGTGHLADMEMDRQITQALADGDLARAQRISAVKTDKVLPTLGAGGKAVFTPVTGGVEMTNLGDASIGAENALAAQRAAAGRLSGVKADAGGFKPGTTMTRLDPTKDFPALASAYGATSSSLYRTKSHNSEVGGVANSQHMKGTAGDFVVPADRKGAFISAAQSDGYQVIDEGDHVHVELPLGAKASRTFMPGELTHGQKETTLGNVAPSGDALRGDAAALRKAADAIRRGADPRKVRQRLIDAGYHNAVSLLDKTQK